MAIYTLPELPYDYAALEPHISAKIMQLHHDKHHATYVAGANAAVEKLEEARANGNFAIINQLEKDLAFNLGGHTNHSLFWKIMAPANTAPDRPSGELAAALDEYFGSFEAFQAHFTAAATGVQGSGWAVLAWDTIAGRPNIFQLFDQQSNVRQGLVERGELGRGRKALSRRSRPSSRSDLTAAFEAKLNRVVGHFDPQPCFWFTSWRFSSGCWPRGRQRARNLPELHQRYPTPG